jgi:hypothetical protein
MKMKSDWATLKEQHTFGYGLPPEHFLQALRRGNSLLMQRITTEAEPPGKILLAVLVFNPLFWFFGLLPLAAIALRLLVDAGLWPAPTYWLPSVAGIAYPPALLLSLRGEDFLRAFRERHQYVGVKSISLDFTACELRVEEELEHAPQRNFRFVLDSRRLRPWAETHLHEPDSDVDFCDEMRIRLVAPRGLAIPDWARSRLEQPVYVLSFDNENPRSRQACEEKIEAVLDQLRQRLRGDTVAA